MLIKKIGHPFEVSKFLVETPCNTSKAMMLQEYQIDLGNFNIVEQILKFTKVNLRCLHEEKQSYIELTLDALRVSLFDTHKMFSITRRKRPFAGLRRGANFSNLVWITCKRTLVSWRHCYQKKIYIIYTTKIISGYSIFISISNEEWNCHFY